MKKLTILLSVLLVVSLSLAQISSPSTSRIRVISPNGGETWALGETHYIRWTYTPQTTPTTGVTKPTPPTFNIYLDSQPTPCPPGEKCPDIIVRYILAENYQTRFNIFRWVINTDIKGNKIQPGLYKVVIESKDGQRDESDAPFKIVGAYLKVIIPNGGETWKLGETRYIRWYYRPEPRMTPVVPTFNIYLDSEPLPCPSPTDQTGAIPCPKLPEKRYTLAENYQSRLNNFKWIVGTDIRGNKINPGSYRVVIESNFGESDESDAPFRIIGPTIVPPRNPIDEAIKLLEEAVKMIEKAILILRSFTSKPGKPGEIPKGQFINSPIGLMLQARGLNTSQAAQLAKSLGATYFRTNSIRVDKWNGTCSDCDAVIAAGLKLLTSIANSGGGLLAGPSKPPADLNVYKQKLGEILDRYPMEILVVENEENSSIFYSGTPQQYGIQLKAACEVAHNKGIKCTNGGLVSSLVAILVWNDYIQAGEVAKAQDFARRTLGSQGKEELLTSPQVKDQIQKGLQLLNEYKNVKPDFVNFHWYFADIQALEEAVNYLKNQTGLPVITNEVGQQFNEDPNQVKTVLQKLLDLKIPYIIWFSVDTHQARSLVNSDGSLRPNGEAFQEFMIEHFSTPTISTPTTE